MQHMFGLSFRYVQTMLPDCHLLRSGAACSLVSALKAPSYLLTDQVSTRQALSALHRS